MQPIQNICIVGAGAIGSLCAVHLGAEVNISVLTRREEHAALLNQYGLKVTGKTNRHTPVSAAVDPADLAEPDLIIIATKATDVEQSAAKLQGHFAGSTVMSIQNGIGSEEVISRFGNWPIISAVTFMSGTRHSDTEVEYELDTQTWMGPWCESNCSFEFTEQVANLFVASGLKAEALQDVRPPLWSKLIFNSVLSSVSVATNLPHVKAYTERNDVADLGHLIFAMMEEGKQVAEAMGIRLPEDPYQMNIRAVRQGSTGDQEYAHIPSMLKDIWAKRHTEVDWITGGLVKAAEQVGVPVPLNKAIYQLVKARELSWKYID